MQKVSTNNCLAVWKKKWAWYTLNFFLCSMNKKNYELKQGQQQQKKRWILKHLYNKCAYVWWWWYDVMQFKGCRIFFFSFCCCPKWNRFIVLRHRQQRAMMKSDITYRSEAEQSRELKKTPHFHFTFYLEKWSGMF